MLLAGRGSDAVSLVRATAAEVRDGDFRGSLFARNTATHEASVDLALASVRREHGAVWSSMAWLAVVADRNADRSRTVVVACIPDHPTVRSCDDFAAKGGDAAVVHARSWCGAAGMRAPYLHRSVSSARFVAGPDVAID